MKILAAALAVISLALGGLLYRRTQECDRLAARAEVLHAQVGALQQAAVDRDRQRERPSSARATLPTSPINDAFIERLRQRGLKNPIEDLIADLQRHPEIIPRRAVAGGRMGFYDRERIRVLSDLWMYAPFEDGHIGGEAILEYHVAPGGDISWRVVTSR